MNFFSKSQKKSTMESKTFQIMLLGDAGVGKTTFLTRHKTGVFVKKYEPTVDTNIVPLTFQTSKGKVTLNIWEVPGQDRFSDYLQDMQNADACIVMFAVDSKLSYKNTEIWLDICKGLPTVLCGNKVDIQERQVHPKEIGIVSGGLPQYYDVSAKSNYNFEKPFLYLLRQLFGDDGLVFTEADEDEADEDEADEDEADEDEDEEVKFQEPRKTLSSEDYLKVPEIREYINSLVAEVFPLGSIPSYVDPKIFFDIYLIPAILESLIDFVVESDLEEFEEPQQLPDLVFTLCPFTSPLVYLTQCRSLNSYTIETKTEVTKELAKAVKAIIDRKE